MNLEKDIQTYIKKMNEEELSMEEKEYRQRILTYLLFYKNQIEKPTSLPIKNCSNCSGWDRYEQRCIYFICSKL